MAKRRSSVTPTPTPMPIFAVVDIPELEDDDDVDEGSSFPREPAAGVIVVSGTTLVIVDPDTTVVMVDSGKTVGAGVVSVPPPVDVTPAVDEPLPDVGVPPGTTVQMPERHARSPSQSPFFAQVAPSQWPGHEQLSC